MTGGKFYIMIRGGQSGDVATCLLTCFSNLPRSANCVTGINPLDVRQHSEANLLITSRMDRISSMNILKQALKMQPNLSYLREDPNFPAPKPTSRFNLIAF